MQRSAQRRSPTALRKRRVIAVGSVVLVVGAMLTVTQISNAGTGRWWGWGWHRGHHSPACPSSSPAQSSDPTQSSDPSSSPAQSSDPAGDLAAADDGDTARLEQASRDRSWRRDRGRDRDRDCTPSPGTSSPGDDDTGGDTGGGDGGAGTVPPGGADGNNNGLEVLGRDCSSSELEPHDGFQDGGRCINTQFGEVGTADQNPTLLITRHPDTVGVNEEFSFTVSTRNLVRDRFLGAGAGGYYLESSFLTEDGLQRGHFHSACRLLQSTRRAPDPEPLPEFFVATEDSRGSARPDTVRINVEGLPTPGTYQCASWAGDPSHRIPMMQRANQVPAFDAFRLEVQ